MVIKNKSTITSGRFARERASPPGEAALAPRAAARNLPPRAPCAPAPLAPQKPRRCAAAPPATPAPSAAPAPSALAARSAPFAQRSPHRGARHSSLHIQPPSVYSKGACRRFGSESKVEAEDVIDLGAPRLPRKPPAEGQRSTRVLLQRNRPNPRLYPGPARAKPKSPPKRAENRGGGEGRRRRRKRSFRRVVPNSRLYRPAPARPPPPPVSPRAAWPPPAPLARLDTASRAALRLSEQRRALRPAPPAACALLPAPPPASPRLVVTLPPAGDGVPLRYQPTSEHFRLRSLDTESDGSPVAGRSGLRAAALAMEAGNRNSASPEDCSDGNETLSAPSEFLAEFLSAIMRRQYAEALKYCRLILQYEPHNATARGFYPLLQHKVQAHKRPDEECARGSSSEEASAPASDALRHEPSRDQHEMMEQGGDSSECSEEEDDESHTSSRSGGSCGSQSSLELDSSEALAHSSPSLSLSRRTEHTDSASGGCWESTGSASRSDADDNGNAPSAPAARLCAGDVANDNAAAAEPLSAPRHKSESSALRRLRAQFTCSIK